MASKLRLSMPCRLRRDAPTLLLAFLICGGCGSSSSRSTVDASADAHDEAAIDTGDDQSSDGVADGPATCTYPDGVMPADGGAFSGICPSGGCPAGTVCVVEVGGVAGGGGESCAPIPNECHGTPSCACMASCVCTSTFGGRPERCTDQPGTIACDNGIR